MILAISVGILRHDEGDCSVGWRGLELPQVGEGRSGIDIDHEPKRSTTIIGVRTII